MAFMLLYWTGMRIGELLALTYEDIDLEKRIISISKSYQRLDGKVNMKVWCLLVHVKDRIEHL